MKFSKPLSLILVFVLLAGLWGCAGGTASENNESVPVADAPRQKLPLSVTFDMNADFTTITSEELNGNFPEDITYLDFTEVTITLNGTEYPLDAAIRGGYTTVEQIIADARSDVKNGFCKELHETEYGLTRFIYQYPDFELEYAYDILEAPDGSQHLIQDFALYPVNKHNSVSHSLTTTDEKGRPVGLLREDWGLTFDVASVTPAGITLNCTQSGGQQFGQLTTVYFLVDRFADDSTNTGLAFEQILSQQTIQMEGNTELMLDWSNVHGQLLSGKYLLMLYVEDNYNSNQLHPLTNNYTDIQRYYIEFSIP